MSVGIRKPKKIAVFVSGSGSTMQALLELHYAAPISLVVSNKKNALALLKAKRFGVPTFLFQKPMTYPELSTYLKNLNFTTLFLAGYMRKLPAEFVEDWIGEIYNIHPSLLPEFPGLESAEKSFGHGQQMGVTIHEVNETLDQGKIFLQQRSLDLSASPDVDLKSSLVYLRRTEQHLLREFLLRKLQ